MEQEKPNITVTRSDENEIIEFGTKKEVKPMGTGGAVILPKALVGKRVEIYYLKSQNEIEGGEKTGESFANKVEEAHTQSDESTSSSSYSSEEIQ